MEAKKKKKSKVELPKVAFKAYEQNQALLFPPALSDLIDRNHPVRVVSDVMDRIDISSLMKTYEGGGCSAYHPRMLLKVLVYGYLCNIYSSRGIESYLKESVHMMWLAGLQRPDHNTINRFRGKRLSGVLKEVFANVVKLLVESGHVSLKQAYTDGTKIEANANRYTFVWAKSVETNRAKLAAQIEELWNHAEAVAAEELKDQRPEAFGATDPQEVARTIALIDAALGPDKKKKLPPKVRKKLDHARKTFPDRVEEYNEKERILDDRGSYSKTDTDATFMRMKDDHLGNGQLKPAYNAQVSSSGQYVTNYSVHRNPGDSTTFPPHFAQFEELYGEVPQEQVTDAGYGSEENYKLLEDNEVDAYVKHNMFHREQLGKAPVRPFGAESLHYNAANDTFTCPMGQPMRNIGRQSQKTSSGFVQHVDRYQAVNCTGCPLRGACHKAEGDRVMEVNHNAARLRAKAGKLLRTARGIELRKKRSCDIETVFGNIKQNKGFRKFMLRGIPKVEIELGLLAIAHNLKKMAS